MANSYINLEKIGQRMLPRFLENLLMPQLTYKDYANEFVNGLGTKIQIRKPFDFVANEFSEDAGIQTQDIHEDSVTITLDKISDVSVSVGALEMAMNMGDAKLNEIIDGMAVALARKVNNDGLGMVAKSRGKMIKDATPYDLDDFSDLRLILNDALAPLENRQAVWNTKADADFTRVGNLVKVNEAGTSTALRQGEIGSVFGLNNYVAQTLPKSNGAHVITGTITVIEGGFGIHCDNCTAVPGDVALIDGAHYVIKDVKANVSGGYDVTFNEVLPSTPQSVEVEDADLSFAFHRDALAFVTRPLLAPAGDNSQSATVSYNGIALRLVRDYDIQYKKETISVDILYNYTMISPEHAVAIIKPQDGNTVGKMEEAVVKDVEKK